MNYTRHGDTIIVRLEKGEELCTQLKLLAEKENIKGGSISGIGATDNFTIGVFDLEKQDYDRFSYTDGNYEIVSLAGNLSTMNGEKYQHVHIVCAGKNGLAAGHLFSAHISLTAEIFIQVTDEIKRKRNNELAINTLDL